MDISLFLPLIVEIILPDLMIYSLSNPGNTRRFFLVRDKQRIGQ